MAHVLRSSSLKPYRRFLPCRVHWTLVGSRHRRKENAYACAARPRDRSVLSLCKVNRFRPACRISQMRDDEACSALRLIVSDRFSRNRLHTSIPPPLAVWSGDMGDTSGHCMRAGDTSCPGGRSSFGWPRGGCGADAGDLFRTARAALRATGCGPFDLSPMSPNIPRSSPRHCITGKHAAHGT